MTNQKVDEIDRSIYDFRYEEDDFYRIQSGLTPEIVEKISEEKHDPEWMRQFRLRLRLLIFLKSIRLQRLKSSLNRSVSRS